MSINVFPLHHATVLAMLDRHMVTLHDLTMLDLHGVRLQSDLGPMELAEAYSIIRGVLEARQVETACRYKLLEASE